MPTNTDKPKKTVERMPPRPLFRDVARVAKGKPEKVAKANAHDEYPTVERSQ